MRMLGFVYAIASAIIWGLVYTLDQKILEKISPMALLFFSSLVMTLLTFPFIVWGSQSVGSMIESGKPVLGITLVTTVLVLLANLGILTAIKLIDAPTASIFEIAYPLFVVLFSYLIFGTEMNAYFFLGASLIVAGSAVIIKLS